MYADPAAHGQVVQERAFKRLSPEEEHHAMILATARDLKASVHVGDWARAWVSQPAVFRCLRPLSSLTSVVDDMQAALFFEASQLREKIGEDFEAMYLTTVP